MRYQIMNNEQHGVEDWLTVILDHTVRCFGALELPVNAQRNEAKFSGDPIRSAAMAIIRSL